MKSCYVLALALAASGSAFAQVGIGIATPITQLQVANGNVLFNTAGDVPNPLPTAPANGDGRQLFWYADKAAFRAGYTGSFGSTYWSPANIGLYSFATGNNTRASAAYSFAAGLATTASGEAAVALGNNGTASGERSLAFSGTSTGVGAIALGSGAQATQDDALAMGPSSISSGLASMCFGPSIALGNFAVAIGLQNRAAGQFSFALGKNARVNHQGAFVISDASAGFSSDSAYSGANNQMTMRFAGGFRLFTSQQLTGNTATGVTLASGGGSWASVSDRRKKENFRPVDGEAVLAKVAALPLSTWNYKAQPASQRHMGPMAQDFYAAFGLDGADTTINTVDIDGVNMAAIQGLEKRTAALQQENETLKSELLQMTRRLAALERMAATKPRRASRSVAAR